MPIEITRDSLLIRSWQESDADGLGHAVFDNLDHIRPWLPWARGLPDDPAGVLEAIRQWLVEGVAKPDEAVGLFIDGDVVGGSGLHPRIGPGGLEIGYWVHRNFTRRGIATTVSSALTDQAFGRPDIDRVEIHHDKANIASGGIPRALGFSLVEEVPEVPQTPQQSGVHLIWRLTRAQWSLPSGP
ncbi:MAG TPA: GNAT family N-acetyltransferase [Acidothermaceae bacterium]|jgi:ribosomal-protein-serine acetyltransferase|nr:GNAT family N-acetyltransferase [Acidothermaceae bacterium]